MWSLSCRAPLTVRFEPAFSSTDGGHTSAIHGLGSQPPKSLTSFAADTSPRSSASTQRRAASTGSRAMA
jgi:hypothetical protein